MTVLFGRYRVTLHFAEIQHRSAGNRSFDVLLEGKRVVKRYEPKFFVAETRRGRITVKDGFLEIRLVPLVGNPKISATAPTA